MTKKQHTPHIKNITKHAHKTYRFLRNFRMTNNNLNILITVVAIVMIRRGVRGFLDMILFPNHKILSFAISIILGAIILRLDNKELDEL